MLCRLNLAASGQDGSESQNPMGAAVNIMNNQLQALMELDSKMTDLEDMYKKMQFDKENGLDVNSQC